MAADAEPLADGSQVEPLRYEGAVSLDELRAVPLAGR
jgi:hypothetical protein